MATTYTAKQWAWLTNSGNDVVPLPLQHLVVRSRDVEARRLEQEQATGPMWEPASPLLRDVARAVRNALDDAGGSADDLDLVARVRERQDVASSVVVLVLASLTAHEEMVLERMAETTPRARAAEGWVEGEPTYMVHSMI